MFKSELLKDELYYLRIWFYPYPYLFNVHSVLTYVEFENNNFIFQQIRVLFLVRMQEIQYNYAKSEGDKTSLIMLTLLKII